jgi:hypothetical protein
MFFESENSPFSSVASMSLGWNKLVLHIICGGKTLQSRGGIIVHVLKFGFETFGCEFLVNVFICFDPLIGGPQFHRHSFDVVAVMRVSYHDVPVAFSGSYG